MASYDNISVNCLIDFSLIFKQLAPYVFGADYKVSHKVLSLLKLIIVMRDKMRRRELQFH